MERFKSDTFLTVTESSSFDARSTVILGCSGSVACIKILELIALFKTYFPESKLTIVPTVNALHFFPKTQNGLVQITASDVGPNDPLVEILDPTEESKYSEDFVRSLVQKADALLVAPLGANLMATLTSTAELDDFCRTSGSSLVRIIQAFLRYDIHRRKPFLVAPAMNSMMWNSAVTQKQIHRLRETYQGQNFHILPTVCKASMCGEIGFGCMETPCNILLYLQRAVLRQPLGMPADVLVAPPFLFDYQIPVERKRHCMTETSKRSNFCDFSSHSLPYYACLQRVIDHFDGPYDVLTGFGTAFQIVLYQGLHNTPDWEELERHLDHFIIRPFRSDLQSSRCSDGNSDIFGSAKFIVNEVIRRACLRKPETKTKADFILENPCFSDSDEWTLWQKREDPVLHIALRQWASLLLVLNPDVGLLRRIHLGVCDDLLTCIIRAWDYQKGAFIVFGEDQAFEDDTKLLLEDLERSGFKVILKRRT